MAVLLRDVLLYGEGAPVDVSIDGGEIVAIGPGLDPVAGAEIIDGAGRVLLPGLVDLHTHLREPGREDTETIETGSAAAALGGYTAVFAMANTSPVADSAVVTDHVYRRGREVGLVDVHPVGAVTVGLQGEKLAEMGMMAAGPARVRVFSDDGYCVADPLLMRRALEYSTSLGVLIAQHAEEPRLTKGAVAHEGPEAARLGLTGWPPAAEESIIARDAILARDSGARVHICHASTAGAVELLRWAKAQNIAITAEVTPHHLLLDDSRLATYDSVNRVNPPLRERADVEALRQGLRDGVIDCVATDHAPHAEQDKCCEFAAARPGMLGLETALAIVAHVAVFPGEMTWRDVARVMSERPAQIARLDDHGRPIEVGEPANLTLIDPNAAWTVSPDALASRSRNTPFADLSFEAKPVLTLLRGKVTARDGAASPPEPGAGVSVSDLATLLLVLVVLVGLFSLMALGWRRRGQRQAAAVGELPSTPEQLRELTFGPVSGVYVGSTIAPHWQDRVAVGDWGYRATINLSRYADGYLLERGRGNPMWIADTGIVEVRRAAKLAGKVMPGDGLLVIRWELPTGVVLDTGFRADDKTTYQKLIDARES